MEYEGNIFADNADIEADIIRAEEFSKLYTAIAKLKPQQQDMVESIFLKGISVSDYAAHQGVHHSAISHRLKTVYKKLKKFL